MNTYQYTCVHGTFCQTMGWNSRIGLMDQVLQQLGIDRIFSAPYHPQSSGKQIFETYTEETLQKGPHQLGQIPEPGTSQLQDYTQSSDSRITIFLVYGRDPNLPLHQLLEPMQCFLGDPDSGMLNLETHRLALAIAKKTLDENRFASHPKDDGMGQTSLPNRRLCLL